MSVAGSYLGINFSYIFLSLIFCSFSNFGKSLEWKHLAELALELMNSEWKTWAVLVPDHEALIWL